MKLLLSNQVKMMDMKLNDAGPLSHPNKVPFTCSLFHVDAPSNGSPEGAGGKLILISSAVCDAYLETFVGMGMNIDFGEGMQDHDPRNKVGVITKVYRSLEGKAMAEGYLYGKDFPDVVATIRYYNGLAAEWNDPDYQFGTSIEMEAKVTASTDENVLDVLEFVGTGAAILFAESAAYTTTSFAARNTKEASELKPEEVKTMIDEAMKETKETVSSISASVQKVVDGLATVTTSITDLKAAGEKQKEEEKENAELKAAQERADKAEKELADLKAAAEKNPPAEPQRKTISASQLLSKHGGQAEEGADQDFATFCASVDKLNLPAHESLRLKMQAKNELKGETN